MQTPQHTRGAAVVTFAYSWFVPPFEEMQSKLFRDSKADATADRHEGRSNGMDNIPIHSEPKMHSRTHTDIGCHPGQQHVTSTAVLCDSCDTVVLRMQPSQHWADEPLSCSVLRLIR